MKTLSNRRELPLELRAIHYYTQELGWPMLWLRGKRPVFGGIRSATKDFVVLKQQYDQLSIRFKPNAGFYPAGVDLFVIDIDRRHGGSIESLNFSADALETVICLTPNGWHCYFKVQPGVKYSQSTELCPDGVDPKFEGYCVVPPSRIKNGEWRWKKGHEPWNCSPRDLPEEALRFIKIHDDCDEPPSLPASPEELLSTGGLHPYVAAAVQDGLNKLAAALEGGRNNTLNEVGFSLYQMVHAGLLPEAELFSLLYNAGVSIGLEKDEVIRTLASAKAGAARKPRKVWPELKVRKAKPVQDKKSSA